MKIVVFYRSRISDEWRNKIGEHVAESIENYANERIQTGGFLRAVLENDLGQAVGRADLQNRRNLADIVCAIYNDIPAVSYGDKEAVSKWLSRWLMDIAADEAHEAVREYAKNGMKVKIGTSSEYDATVGDNGVNGIFFDSFIEEEPDKVEEKLNYPTLDQFHVGDKVKEKATGKTFRIKIVHPQFVHPPLAMKGGKLFSPDEVEIVEKATK